MTFTFNKIYAGFTTLLFFTEIIIAIYAHDDFIRPYAGDVLVVILIYCALKTCINLPVIPTVLGVFIFACFIECMQYIGLVKLIGLSESTLANTLIGNYFTWADILAYASGSLIILLLEHIK